MTILCMSNFAYSAGENDANNLSNTDQALTVGTNNNSQLTISNNYNNPLNEANFLENAAQMIDSMQIAIDNALTKYYEDGAFIDDLPFALSAVMFLSDPKSLLMPIHLVNMLGQRRLGENPMAGGVFYWNALLLIASPHSSMAPVHIAVMALTRKL